MRRFLHFIIVLNLCLSFLAGATVVSHGDTPGQQVPLVVNPGFEEGLQPWVACGGAVLVDAQATGSTAAMVHSGRYALRIGNPTGTDCPPPPPEYSYLGQMDQALFQPVTIPADAAGVTVSFWYSFIGDASASVYVMLTKELYDFTYNPDGATLDRLLAGDQPGWHHFRQVLTADELAEVKAQGTLNLQFTVEDPLGTNENSAFYIDDVQVTLANITTAASPLPAALKSDDTQPLVYEHSAPENPSSTHSVYRMETDGSNAYQIFDGFISRSDDPTWSPDGSSIAIIDANFFPVGETDPDKTVPATALVLVNPNGNAPRTVYQTGGRPGDPALISALTNLTWSPDGRMLAASTFDYLRNSNGSLEGGLSNITQIDVITGVSSQLLQYATSPSWSSTNQLLFEVYDLHNESDRDKHSIWTLDLTQDPLAAQLLIPNPTARFDEDFDAVWAPDGQQFVTIRTISGNHYETDGDKRYNQALMLTDLVDVDNPRLLLLGDHGNLSDPAWSPDGKYITYTLWHDDQRDIWWLDVAAGTTGPLTSDGLSHNAHWRPTSISNVFLPLIQQ